MVFLRTLIVLLTAAAALAPAGAQTAAPVVDFGLLDLEQLAQIKIVSVTHHATALRDTAAAVTVLTDRELRRSGATTLPDALRGVPGVEVGSVNSRSFGVTIRGFNGSAANKLLTLIDGRSLYSLRFASTIWDIRDLPLEDIAQVEVVRGPGGTRWGANAVNGVINIVTKDARDTLGTLVSATAGTFERGAIYLREGREVAPDTWLRVYTKAFARDDSEPVNLRDNNDAWTQVRTGFRLDRERTPQSAMTVTGDFFHSEADQFVGGLPDKARSTGGHLLFRQRWTPSPDAELRLQGYFDGLRRDSGGNRSEADTLDLEVSHEFLAGQSHRISYGGNLRRSRLEDTVNSPGFIANFHPMVRNFHQASLFAQDTIIPADPRWIATVGVKSEYNDFTDWDLLPSARLAWTPSERSTVWSAVSRAVRIPSRFENDQDFLVTSPGFTARTVPSPDLRAECLNAYELGWRARPMHGLSLDATLFLHDYSRLVTSETVPVVSPPGSINSSSNLGYGQARGIEAAVTGEIGPWQLRATWTHLELDLRTQPSSVDTALRATALTSPRDQYALRATWDSAGPWEFDAAVRHIGPIRAINRSVAAYTTADLRVARRLGRGCSVAFVGQNLFDPAHEELRFFTTRTEVARSFYLQVEWQHR